MQCPDKARDPREACLFTQEADSFHFLLAVRTEGQKSRVGGEWRWNTVEFLSSLLLIASRNKEG